MQFGKVRYVVLEICIENNIMAIIRTLIPVMLKREKVDYILRLHTMRNLLSVEGIQRKNIRLTVHE